MTQMNPKEIKDAYEILLADIAYYSDGEQTEEELFRAYTRWKLGADALSSALALHFQMEDAE